MFYETLLSINKSQNQKLTLTQCVILDVVSKIGQLGRLYLEMSLTNARGSVLGQSKPIKTVGTPGDSSG